MNTDRCIKYINNNSKNLVITIQCFYTLLIIDNKFIIDDNLKLPPFCMENAAKKYIHNDYLLIRYLYGI